MIELLVVIVIIALLIGLLIPAVQGAVQRAREAQATTDINSLAQALAAFKTHFGDYPPSRIVLVESGRYDMSTTGNMAASPAFIPLAPRSMTYLRKFWPRMVLNTGTSGPTIPGGWYDFDGDGKNNGDSPYILTGTQCLVFFLGGLPQTAGAGGGWSMSGWAKNPQNPMQNSTANANRYPSYFEFNNSRLADDPSSGAGPPHGFPGYLDTLGSFDSNSNPPFYAYFSAYNGAGYDPGDNDFSEADLAGSTTSILGAFTTGNALTSTSYSANPPIVASPAPNPYTNDVPVHTSATGAVDTTTPVIATRPIAFQNPNSFQIISCGYDRLYGIGGQYNSKNTETTVPFVDGTSNYTANTFQTQQANATVTGQTLNADVRQVEADNLTNFATGRLQ